MRFLFSLGTAVFTALLVTAPTLAQTGSRANPGAAPLAAAPAVIEAQPTALRGTVTESFDDVTTLPGAGWALINNSQPLGTTGWFQGSPTTFPSQAGAPNAYIGANFNNTTGATGTISNWLLTPVVVLANGTELTFWSRAAAQTFPDRLEVRLSPSGTSTDIGATATSVGDFQTVLLSINPTLAPSTYPVVWTQYTATVSGLAAPTTGRFAFRYFVTGAGPTGSNSNYIGIDEVTISQPAGTAVLVVTTADDELNTDGDCSLREAVQAANTGMAVDACAPGAAQTIISFQPSLAGQSIPTTGLIAQRDLTIDGTSAPGLTLDGGTQGRIMRVEAGERLTLRALTLIRGRDVRGGAVLVGADARFRATGVQFRDNEATGGTAAVDGGGAVYLEAGAEATIASSVFEANRASGAAGSGGALFNFQATALVSGSQFVSNTANRAGGAVEAVAGTTTLSDVLMSDNDTGANPGNGGGLHVTGAGTAVVSGGVVRRNTGVEGGGLWCAATCTMTVTGTAVLDNVATGGASALKGGGGLFNLGTMSVVNATITSNAATSIDGTAGSGGGILNVGGTLSVVGGVIQNNSAPRAGGGIESNAGSVALANVLFIGNTTGASPGNGGALHVTGAGTVTATGGSVRDNVAAREGGGFWNDTGLMTVTGTTFMSNRADGPAADDGGGGLFNNGGTLVLEDVTVTDNAATGAAGSGGGVFTLGGLMRITGGTISGNRANRAGAGVENATGPSGPGTTEMTDVTVVDNMIVAPAPGNGGGLHSGGGTVTIRGGTFSGNVAAEGGGLWSDAVMTVAPSAAGPTVITDNEATGASTTTGGGGVFVQTGGEVTLTDVVLTDNRATGTAGSGGGLFVADGSMAAVEGGVVRGNEANRAGAGLEVADDPATPAVTTLAVRRATVADNVIVTAAPGNGGGLHIGGAGVATVSQSTFSNNTAREGAGLWMAGGSTLELTLSTVSGNVATENGGGVYDNGGSAPATIRVVDATIVGNTAGGAGGGLLSESTDGASFSVRNTIVATNTASTGADCAGAVESQGYNLFLATAGCTVSGQTPLDIVGLDPMLGPLADNGGPTFTHEPMAGSPAVDAGQSDATVDQRGFARNVGTTDIGSVERGAGTVSANEPAAPAEFALATSSPNPARGEASVRFTLAEAAPTTLTLYDALGRTVATLYDGEAAAATAHVARVPAGLAPGVYVLRLVSGAESATSRLTVVR